MFIDEIFLEMALPTESIKAQRYYHGTASEAAAQIIIQEGIKPPDLELVGRKKNGYMTPVAGKVYITPDISYAQIYAIGANVAGDKSYQVPYEGNENTFKSVINFNPQSRYYGRYGYVFVISGDQLSDVQPDEDSIGEFLNWILNDGHDKHRHIYTNNCMISAWNDKHLVSNMKWIASKYLADSTVAKIKDGWADYYAKGGKVLVKKMPDWMKLKMVEYGFHCAHTGPLMPTEVWQIDKTKIGWLNKDGSNFFEIAKRVK